MRIVTIIVCLVISNLCFAAEIGKYNAQHTAEQAGRNVLREQGCAWTKTAMDKQYTLVEDPKGVRVIGFELLITCIEQDKSYKAKLTWTAPTKRKDGSLLASTEIKGYLITFGANSVMVPAVNEYVITGLTVGTYKFTMQTVDINNIMSDKSDELTVTIGGNS